MLPTRMQDRGRWLRDQLRALGSGRRLDVGCGSGRLLDAGDVGIDLDPERVAVAHERSRLVTVADARSLPFRDGAFDTAYAIRMLNDTGNVDAALREIRRVLGERGRLLVYTRARRAVGDRLDPENGLARLGAHFRTVRALPEPGDPGGVLFVADR